MDSARFDTAVRALASGMTRRGVLAGVAGGLLATLPLALGDEAQSRRKKKKKKKAQTTTPAVTGCVTGAQIAQLSVPYTGVPVLTPVLAQGQVYTVQVSGAAATNAVHSVDAEYDFITATPNDLTKVLDIPNVDVGLSIDDATTDTSKTPKWGPYNPAHIYSQQIVGKGQPASLLLQDSVYGDNSGAVTVTITCG